MKARGYIATAVGLVVLTAGFILVIPADIERRPVPPRPVEVERRIPDNDADIVASEPTEPEVASEADTADLQASRDEPEPAPAAPDITADDETANQSRLLALPVAEDAGRLRVGDGLVELRGLEAPTATQSCGTGREEWPCGMRGRTALRAYLRGRSIECEAPEGFGEREKTISSACTVAGEDVGAWVVANGWAEAAAGSDYAPLEREARDKRIGLWR